MNARRLGTALALVAILVVGFLLGRVGHGGRSPGRDPVSPTVESPSDSESEATVWTCSMHPQIRLPGPGKCPICSMDLIPVRAESDATGTSGARTLTMTPAAMKLAEIQTTRVVARHPVREVRLVGKVAYDETRRRQITAWTGGRLDRLYVDFVGIDIRKGDHLAEVYSPDLVNAQDELLQAHRAASELSGSDIRMLRDTAQQTIEAAREKLRLLGLSPAQIEAIEKRGTVQTEVTILAPMDGIVISKRALEGSYVKTGEVIYEIVDLSRVWLVLDAYESDIEWLRYGQKVVFEVAAFPGRTFEGQVVFIDPVLDAKTRTTRVRVNVANPDLFLKPGMFAHAHVRATLASGGKVMAPDLAGKWICPMHPEVIKDRPGTCDVCGMSLVRAESLGYVVPSTGEVPLVIPASAPLVTGTRAVVYVRVPNAEKPTFEGREVVLGPRAGDEYIVISGLAEGEEIVTNGAFKIDSAMQIQAKPSMMLPEGGVAPDEPSPASVQKLPAPPAFVQQLAGFSETYLGMVNDLACDHGEDALKTAASLPARLATVDMELLSGPSRAAWMQVLPPLKSSTAEAAGSKSVEALRQALPALTAAAADAIRRFGLPTGKTAYRFHCPMAFEGKGADWMQSGKETANPYYGAAMPRCGTQVEVLAGGDGEG